MARGGLYGFFVKGEALQGTIADPPNQQRTDSSTMAEVAAPLATDILAKALAHGGPLEVKEYGIERKRKKEHVPAKEVRKKRKLKQVEESRENAKKNRQQAIADGTFDYEADEVRRKEHEINKIVKANIEKRLRAGEFGPILPHPSSFGGAPQKKYFDVDTNKMLSYKGEKYKREKNKRVAKAAEKERLTRLMYPELLPPSVEHGATQDDVNEWRRQEKLKKIAKRQAKAEKEQAKAAALAADQEAKQAERAEHRKARNQQKEETALGLAALKAVTEQEKAAILASSEAGTNGVTAAPAVQPPAPARFTNGADFVSLDVQPAPAVASAVPEAGGNLPVTAKSRAQLIRENLTSAKPAELGFDPGADVIDLGVTKKGRMKRIPHVGAVDKYPTKAEKRQKKQESRAFEAGLTLDEYKAKLEKEKWEAEAPERERIAQVQSERGGLTGRAFRKKNAQERDRVANAIYLATGKFPAPGTYDADEILKSSDLSKWMPKTDESVPAEANDAEKPPAFSELSEKKRKGYALRAAEKGLSAEEYYAQRAAKKAKLAESAQADAAETTDANPGPAFVIDTAGDSNLTNQSSMPVTAGDDSLAFVVDTVGNAGLTNAKSGDRLEMRWHPDMLGDRKVKELTKQERRARLEWLRARRAARHTAAGRDPISKKERHKRRVEKKQGTQNRLVYQVLHDKLKESGRSTSEKVGKVELKDARRIAKRQMREQKRIKRNKVIHRKNEKVVQRISTGRA
ncbi:MAG: hypothetical protein INR71_03385 [Terriglobus roseus]|nr:hypothetical protein [Terriglobus roseus]